MIYLSDVIQASICPNPIKMKWKFQEMKNLYMEDKVYPKQVIYADIPSKSNCYKIIVTAGFHRLGKTKAVKDYENKFFMQCSLRNACINGNFRIDVDCYNSSNRKDLDNSFKLLLDCLQQCKAIKNDRQCVEIHARKFVDKVNPRVEFQITEFA